MIDHRRADFVHNEIKYLVGMFEERFINPDGTRFPIMDSPIVQRALNLDYTSLPDAEHILSSLQVNFLLSEIYFSESMDRIIDE